jgi:DNA processing protein
MCNSILITKNGGVKLDLTLFLFKAAHCRGLGRPAIRKLLRRVVEESVEVEKLSAPELADLLKVPYERARAFHVDWCRFSTENLLDIYRQTQTKFVTWVDPGYPLALKTIPDPPLVLFYRGNPSLFTHPKALSVVGTRRPTDEGINILCKVLQPLIEQKWTIVSGLANGIDGCAHTLALNAHTIAVLGSGFNHVYPKENKFLFQKITSDHLAISEYPLNQRPQKWFFPERNRLISGLSPATLVVEAKEKSGSLITADQALEQGREVLALPGSLLNPNAQGTNSLIKQGATLILSPEDLLQELISLPTFYN